MVDKCLIDRGEFIKGCNRLIEERPYIHHAANWEKGLELAVEIAVRLSPVDAVEVVHGRWVWKDLHGDGSLTLCCSVCLGTEGARETAHYCSECGAKMDEN